MVDVLSVYQQGQSARGISPKQDTKSIRNYWLFSDNILLFDVLPRIMNRFAIPQLCWRGLFLGEAETTENRHRILSYTNTFLSSSLNNVCKLDCSAQQQCVLCTHCYNFYYTSVILIYKAAYKLCLLSEELAYLRSAPHITHILNWHYPVSTYFVRINCYSLTTDEKSTRRDENIERLL